MAPDSEGGGGYVTLPRSLVPASACWQFDPSKSAICAEEPGGPTTEITTRSPAGRYHPWYYAVVGGPLVLFPNWAGIILARLISAALAAALLATALLDAMRWSRYRFAVAGVLVSATPTAAMLGGAINPNGTEIAAAIAFFAAAVPLLTAKSAEAVTPVGAATQPPVDATQHDGPGDGTNGSDIPPPEDAQVRGWPVASDPPLATR